jgi:hypothetical protein
VRSSAVATRMTGAHMHLTRAGRRLLVPAEAAVVDVEQSFLAPLPAAEQERLKQALRVLLSR